MSQQNQVAVQIPPDRIQQVMQHLQEINDILTPYLIALTADERHTLAKMGDKTIAFVQKTVEFCQSNPEFIPSYLNLNDLQIDLHAVTDLTPLFNLSQQICSKIDDTVMLSGSEAYIAALMYYSTVSNAAKNGITNAKPIYENLKERFPGRALKKTPANTTP